MKPTSWLLLLFSLPTKRKTERVAVWRRLKKLGAVQITTSTYLLPDEAPQYEQFQWLAKQIRDYGGDSTLVRAREIEGLNRDEIVSFFNSARDKEYVDLRKALQHLVSRKGKRDSDAAAGDLERLTKQFRELRQIDFFDSARGHEVAMLLRRAEGPARMRKLPTLERKNYHGKKWLTRPRPEIDRVGSAWLISKFIDPKARFVFAASSESILDAIPFDMLDAEFSHHGPNCTFETLTKRFGIADKAIAKIGEMIHDADLDDAKFQRTECIGIDRVLKGWAREGISDKEILRRGFECFGGLYASLRRE
jgi:hypothetical protein